MRRKHFLVVFGVTCVLACLQIAFAEDVPPSETPNIKPLYLHLFGSHRAKHHDPWDSRPESAKDWAPVWSCVATIRVYDGQAFYLRAPSNRDPYVMLDGHVSKRGATSYRIELKYELDDSNMTYIEKGKYTTSLDSFITVADGLYWRLILSNSDDAYDAFDSAEKNAAHAEDNGG